ncbi:BTB/POZ domain-containing protein, partial [Trifolium medium]|nr:BTB/POZ domain-containing protein [Trifolium medium]
AHPFLSDTDRKKVCSMMDCQKLSREARVHAAQNKWLKSSIMNSNVCATTWMVAG